MDKKAVSMVLVDLFAAAIIMLAIVGFYFAFKLSIDKLQVSIKGNIKESELDSIMLTYLRIPTEYKGVKMTNGEKIMAKIYDGSIKDWKEPYIREYIERTGYCIESISIYKGDGKVTSIWDSTACRPIDNPLSTNPTQRSWIVLPAPDGTLYYVKAQGHMGSE